MKPLRVRCRQERRGRYAVSVYAGRGRRPVAEGRMYYAGTLVVCECGDALGLADSFSAGAKLIKRMVAER